MAESRGILVARRVASAAAYGSAGLSVLGAGLYGVLTAEARMARRTIGETSPDPVPDPSGWYGRGRPGPAVKIVLLGDSSAVGYGVDRVEQTPGALLASGVAEQGDRRVFLRTLCRVGAVSAELDSQIDRALPLEPHVAMVLVGANDVTHVTPPSHSVRQLADGVRRLTESGVAVVVGTCPDLGTIKPIAPPLKQVARAWSRRLAAAQTVAVLAEGGRTVSLGSILGPEFAAAPALLFGPDQFHPSAEGYRALVRLLLPTVLAAVGLGPDDEEQPETTRGEGVMPVVRAAQHAVNEPGTELGGVRGRLVELRHRRRRPQTEGEAPESTEVEGRTS